MTQVLTDTIGLRQIDYDTIDIGNFETSLTPSLPEAMKSTEPSRRKWPKRPGRYKNASPTAKHVRACFLNECYVCINKACPSVAVSSAGKRSASTANEETIA